MTEVTALRRAPEPKAPARCAVAGCLPDGTPFYAPVGEVVTDGNLVVCHLCGQPKRSVTAHLRGHGWTKQQYCAAFGLEYGQSLEGSATRKLRSAAFTARLLFEPAVRDGSAAGRARAKSGSLSRDAAAAARGRPLPEQRRRKAASALARVPRESIAAASAERAARQIAETAGRVAAASGYRSIGDLVRARAAAGASLAAVSRDCGLHKDWLSRHLPALDPVTAQWAAAEAARARAAAADERWRDVLTRLDFADVSSYLRDRHAVRHQTVNQIAAEAGVSHHAVQSALRRHGMAAELYAGRRHAARERAAAVAATVGFGSIAEYVARRRADGCTWAAIAAESGQPQSWLRRYSS